MKVPFPKLLLIQIIALLLFSCSTETETIIYESPNIRIISVDATSLNSCTIHLDINEGEGQALQKVEIVFKDITIEGEADIKFEYTISDYENFPNTIEVGNLKRNHDYEITAYLHTNKYSYQSNLQILRSIKNTFQVRIWDDERFSYLDESISAYLNREDEFVVNIDYISGYEPQSLEIKLDGTSPLEIDTNYSNITETDGIITLTKLVKIPMDAPIGEHHVHVYIDGIELVSVNTLKILERQWEIFDSNFEDFYRGDFSWFKIDNKLYIVGGNYPQTQLTESPVWEFDIDNKIWTRKNNFQYVHDIISIQDAQGKVEILPYPIQYNNEGYILVKYDLPSFYEQDGYTLTKYERIMELWKYNTSDDSWKKITDYQGKTNDYMMSFVINDKLYLGGGFIHDDSAVDQLRRNKEFWCYSFNNNNWEQLNDVPVEILFWRLPTCTVNDKAYVFSTYNNFWEYNPSGDSWVPLGKFPGSYRHHTQMVSFNGNLFLIGGETEIPEYKPDCWRYYPSTNKWEMIAMFSNGISDWGVSFTHNNSIYTGLGYYIDRNNWLGDIYKLNME